MLPQWLDCFAWMVLDWFIWLFWNSIKVLLVFKCVSRVLKCDPSMIQRFFKENSANIQLLPKQEVKLFFFLSWGAHLRGAGFSTTTSLEESAASAVSTLIRRSKHQIQTRRVGLHTSMWHQKEYIGRIKEGEIIISEEKNWYIRYFTWEKNNKK